MFAADSPITADASRDARTSRDYAIQEAVGIADVGNGRTANVDAIGALYTTDAYSASGATTSVCLSATGGADVTLDTGAGYVKGVYAYFNTADDYVIGRDATSENTGTIVFDIQGPANNGVYVPINKTYSTGLTVVQSASGNNANVVWKSID
ncbi:MAG: hypothetical protein ACFFG0_03465 [Candidatus Thorarchaeota archaeon]